MPKTIMPNYHKYNGNDHLSISNNANLLCCHSPQKETYTANLQILVEERVLLQTDQTERQPSTNFSILNLLSYLRYVMFVNGTGTSKIK